MNSNTNLNLNEKDLRSKVQEVMNRLGLKQNDIARETGVPHSTLSLWLQKKTTISIRNEEIMEKYLINLNSSKVKQVKVTNKLYSMKYKKDTDFENVNNNNGFGNLIPITLNIDIDGKKFTDQFFWEKDEPYLSVEQYSKILIEENNLPKSFDAEIINQITKQINGYSDFFIGTNDEMIKIIKLDVRIDDRVLTDSFIWDINNPMNIPENFAVDYCRDLNLGSEFIVPISLSIREQLIEQRYTYNDKNRYYYNLANSRNKDIEKNENFEKNEKLKCIKIFNDQPDSSFQPYLTQISANEVLKYKQREDRKTRYLQRKK